MVLWKNKKNIKRYLINYPVSTVRLASIYYPQIEGKFTATPGGVTK